MSTRPIFRLTALAFLGLLLVVGPTACDSPSRRGGADNDAGQKPQGEEGEGEGEAAGDGDDGQVAGEGEGDADGGGADGGEGEGEDGGDDGDAGEGEGEVGGDDGEGEGEVGGDDGGEGEGEGEGGGDDGGEGEGEGEGGDDGGICDKGVELDNGCGQGEVGELLERLWSQSVSCEVDDDCVVIEGLRRGWCSCGRTALSRDADAETLQCLQSARTRNYEQNGCPLPGCPAPSPGMCEGDASCEGGTCVVLHRPLPED